MPSPDAPQNEKFMRLLVTHEPQILRAIMVLVPQAADARDVLQETAVNLWKHFHQYDPERPFVNWALGYARNSIRRHFRSQTRRQRLSEKAEEALLISAAILDEKAQQLSDALHACLQKVPPPGRSILEGYYFHQQGMEELTRLHAKSADAIYKIIQRLRHALLDCINKRLADPTDA